MIKYKNNRFIYFSFFAIYFIIKRDVENIYICVCPLFYLRGKLLLAGRLLQAL